MAGATIEFQFDTSSAEARFLREYLADAWHRFETNDYWETGWYWSYRQFSEYESGLDGGVVQLIFEGDPDGLIENESDAWDHFDGLRSWEVRWYEDEGYDSLLEQQIEAKGETGGVWDYRLKPLTSQFSLASLREFEDSLPVVSDGGEENPKALGFWAVVHYVMIQCGYDWYDEIAACQKAMQNRLKSIAFYRGADAAREEYARLLAEWDAHEETLEESLEEMPTGEASVP